jgi:hypothetical protein
MTDINGLRYQEVDFNADGTLDTIGGGGDGGLPAAVAAGGITALFVLSHGWNSGVDSFRDLYQAPRTGSHPGRRPSGSHCDGHKR